MEEIEGVKMSLNNHIDNETLKKTCEDIDISNQEIYVVTCDGHPD